MTAKASTRPLEPVFKRSACGPKGTRRYRSAKTVSDRKIVRGAKRHKHPQNIEENQGPTRGDFDTFKPRWKAAALKWERLNEVTYKLVVKDKVSHTPASHGQWPGFHTSYPAAWLMNTNWWSGGGKSWVGRCRDERGNWSFGPTTFEDARRVTKDWVLDQTSLGGFTDDPIRDLHESALLSNSN
jgi:hypothetical protein